MSGSVVNFGPTDAVYTGFWVNWSYGWTRGATLTLSHRDAGFLTAFLALFVSIAGRYFWRLFCFTVHSRLSTNNSQDGLYHQQQAVLRNAATDVTGLHLFLQLAWHWRNRSTKQWSRLLKVIIPTVFIIAAFNAASIFSSQVR